MNCRAHSSTIGPTSTLESCCCSPPRSTVLTVGWAPSLWAMKAELVTIVMPVRWIEICSARRAQHEPASIMTVSPSFTVAAAAAAIRAFSA